MKEYHIRREGRFYQLLSKPLYRGLLYVTLSLIATLIISLLFYNFNVSRIQSSTDTEQFDKIELMVSDIQNNLRLSSSPLMLASENKSLLRITSFIQYFKVSLV